MYFDAIPKDLKDEFNNMLHQEKEHVVSVNDVKSNFIKNSQAFQPF